VDATAEGHADAPITATVAHADTHSDDTADVEADSSQEQRIAALRAEHANLKLVLDGEAPIGCYIEDLFSFDLSTKSAIDAARKDLSASIERWESRLKELEAGKPPEASDSDSEAADNTKDTNDAKDTKAPATSNAPSSAQTAVGDAGTEEAGADEAAATEEELTDSFDELKLQIATASARLEFLNWPEGKRNAALTKDAQRKLASIEAERARDEQLRAEAARKKALAEADRAKNEIDRVLANERARMEGVRGFQAIGRRELAERRQSWTVHATERSREVNALIRRGTDVEAFSESADALYDEVAIKLKSLREQVSTALSAYAESPSAARYSPDDSYESIKSKITEPVRAEIDSNLRELSLAATELENQTRSLSWIILESSVKTERDLNLTRIELLNAVSHEKRATLLGFGKKGFEELVSELDRVAIEATWYRVHFDVRIQYLKDLSNDPFWIGNLAWITLQLLCITTAAAYIHRRGPSSLERLRVVIVRSVKRPTYARYVAAIIDNLEAILPSLVFLLSIMLAIRVLGPTGRLPEFALPLRLLLWYGFYRLFIVVSHRLVYKFLSTETTKDRSAKRSKRSELVGRSVRTIARYTFGTALTLTVASEILGKGYLYDLVLRVAWIGTLPLFIALLRRWHEEIATSYVARRPDGRFAELVRSTHDRPYGFLVAAVAIVVLFGRAALRAARRFVLGFEQSRKALAFLFRRRLEMQTTIDASPPSAYELFSILDSWFSNSPVRNEEYALSDLEGMDIFENQYGRWASGKPPVALLVVGNAGFGKTSWLNLAERKADEPVRRIVLRKRMLTEDELLAFLASELNIKLEVISRSAVIAAISSLPRQLIIIDDVHLLALRGVDTLGAWDAFLDIVEHTDNTFWVAAMNAFAYQHVAWVRKGAGPFRSIIKIRPWTDTRIAALLDARSKASGYEIVYDDLIVDKMEGVEGQAQLISTQQDYSRLIWDYADGCPEVALLCWRNSLQPDGPNRLRVRLFRLPNANALEALNDPERFLLASVVWHGSITASDAVVSLNMSMSQCMASIEKLIDDGVLEEKDSYYHVVPRWVCPVIRFLRRKHLITD